MNKERVLVSGGAGFIGSHIVEQCIKEGYDVVVVDDLSTGNLSNLYYASGHFKFYQCDISVYSDDLIKAFDRVDYVIHQAARLSGIESDIKRNLYHDVNTRGTFNILNLAYENKVKSVVLASSCAIQGTSFYAATKEANEIYARYFHTKGLETVCLRYQNVYGPRQDSCVIPKFVRALIAGETPAIYGDGTQTRDFVSVHDVVRANLQSLTQTDISGRWFDIATGNIITVNELYSAIQRLLGTSIAPDYVARPEGEIINIIPCKPDLDLNWMPLMPFNTGLRETVEYYKND